jgi:hypothetical protein
MVREMCCEPEFRHRSAALNPQSPDPTHCHTERLPGPTGFCNTAPVEAIGTLSRPAIPLLVGKSACVPPLTWST